MNFCKTLTNFLGQFNSGLGSMWKDMMSFFKKKICLNAFPDATLLLHPDFTPNLPKITSCPDIGRVLLQILVEISILLFVYCSNWTLKSYIIWLLANMWMRFLVFLCKSKSCGTEIISLYTRWFSLKWYEPKIVIATVVSLLLSCNEILNFALTGEAPSLVSIRRSELTLWM